jgi:uncharacterized protein YqkB
MKQALLIVYLFSISLHVESSEDFFFERFDLKDPTSTKADRFGYSVAQSGDYLLVGAVSDDSLGSRVGQVYVFNALSNQLIHTLNDPSPTVSDAFGYSAVLSGNVGFIGAPRDDSLGNNVGQVHMFDIQTGRLIHTFDNPSPNENDMFGISIASDGNYVAIGAHKDDTTGTDQGIVHVFNLKTKELRYSVYDPTPTVRDQFGISVSIANDILFVGAHFDDSMGNDVGQVHSFRIIDGELLHTFNDPTTTNVDRFGTSISAEGGQLLVGANGDDTSGSGVGQAYLFNADNGQLIHIIDDPTPTNVDLFGTSVSLHGSIIVVGARTDDTVSINAGQVHIFDRTTGKLEQTIDSPSKRQFSNFGSSIAINDYSILVGAYNDNTNGFSAGKAYLFELNSTCSLSNTLTGLSSYHRLGYTLEDPTKTRADRFGNSVAVDDDSLLVGSRADETLGDDIGQAHMYDVRSGRLLFTLDDPTPSAKDMFGYSVSVKGDIAAIGAPNDSTFGNNIGQVHIFDSQTGELIYTFDNPQPNEGDMFGISTALAGNYIAVGAHRDDTTGDNQGAVYVFNTETKQLLYTIYDPTPTNQDEFGVSIAISNEVLYVGAHFDDTEGNNVGQVHSFRLGTGSFLRTYNDPTATSVDRFGTAISADGNHLLVGANGDDSIGQGIGQAYLFNASNGDLLHIFDDPTPTYFDRFGTAVAVKDSLIAIGVRTDDTLGTNVGQTHVFDTFTGELLQTIDDPTVSAFDNFGSAVAISERRILIGANNDDTNGFSVGQAHLFNLKANCM